MSERLTVTYHLDVEAADAEARAEQICREQTVEVPAVVVRDAFFADEVKGRVERIEEAEAGGQLAVLSYPVAATASDPAQLLNVIFGNSSLCADVRCVDVELPAALCVALEGPRFGAAGVRERVGAVDRALTCTAIKPMGLSTEALAELCGTFARAGIDVIKDDHGLAGQPWSAFEARVTACLGETRAAADASGREALYVPNLIGTPQRVLRGLAFAQEAGARAVMVSPMLVGLPFFWELVHRHADVPVLAHPAFGGAVRIDPVALFGRLWRAYGADAVIFVSFGSRFSAGREACRVLAERLSAPCNGLLSALPVPAGGIRLENVAEAAAFYGRESMLLVGGDLQVEPGAIFERARRFVDIVATVS
ncbi:MAG: ribulose 1,5-bisphosphate carboxylase [Deltaproteobacteria bacterium]|nr:ribulose 1,5-bisphosphate carboxylase [Deltaproteobacteria bacterium]MBW2360036.1 ribulose 1,5-bisphosphate carboxylase [Deltaproteobacteria bacterium]